jgi:hypothetical protein
MISAVLAACRSGALQRRPVFRFVPKTPYPHGTFSSYVWRILVLSQAFHVVLNLDYALCGHLIAALVTSGRSANWHDYYPLKILEHPPSHQVSTRDTPPMFDELESATSAR